jgi:hypothetical protein
VGFDIAGAVAPRETIEMGEIGDRRASTSSALGLLNTHVGSTAHGNQTPGVDNPSPITVPDPIHHVDGNTDARDHTSEIRNTNPVIESHDRIGAGQVGSS